LLRGRYEARAHSQLQQSQVGIAVESSVLALLHDVVLEYCGCLGVISVKAAEDGIDVGRPCVAPVKSDAHFVGCEVVKKKERRKATVREKGEEVVDSRLD
jgi:hypothetical protein